MQEYIKLINQQEANIIVEKLIALNKYFIDYGDMKVLGSASYIHKNNINLYKKIKDTCNPIIYGNFSNLIDKIKNYLELKFQKQFELDNNLSYPGFHIFSASSIKAFEPTTSLHIDTPHELHEEYFIENYKNVDFDFPITFTLCLLLPKNGGGLYYWDIENWETKTLDQVDDFYSPIYKKYDDLFSIKNPTNKEYIEILKPKLLNYTSGYINVFKGNLLHQIEPFRIGAEKEELRITLQGHAIQTQTKWIIYF